MIQEKQKLSGTLNNKQFLNGSLSNSVIYVDPITQEKTVIPTAEQQIITPDKEYTGLSKVTVEAIQDNNLIPENIKNGVDILGVTGNFIGEKYAPRYITFYNYKGTELDNELANLDTSNISSMYYMFYNCNALTTLDLSNFDTSKVTMMNAMFQNCLKLETLKISNFNTLKVTNFYQMFYRCQKIVAIPKLNASSSTNTGFFVYGCSSLTDFGGLENLGQAYSTTTSANNSNYKLDLSTCTALTEQSLINVLNNLYDIATKGCNVQQVILGSTNLAKLTSTEGQTALTNATAKGWSVS
ncbi:MAG: BspA family leucine-rich repeat surface protein [Clostridia bacterium]